MCLYIMCFFFVSVPVGKKLISATFSWIVMVYFNIYYYGWVGGPCCGKCCTKAKQKGLSNPCPKLLQFLGNNWITWVLRRTFRCSLNRGCILLTLLSPCGIASLHLGKDLTQSQLPLTVVWVHKAQRQTIPGGSDMPGDEVVFCYHGCPLIHSIMREMMMCLYLSEATRSTI